MEWDGMGWDGMVWYGIGLDWMGRMVSDEWSVVDGMD